MVKAAPITPPAAEPETTAPVTPPPARRRSPVVIAGIVLVVLAALLMVRLGAQDRAGPAHMDVSIGDGIPATLYLPYGEGEDEFPPARPAGQRPPVVVIAHGYSADRPIMSTLARSLAEAGYGAVTFDFRGHGENTHEFRGDLKRDFDAVVDYVETGPYFDRERIAILGHSMGAGAALDFGTVDSRPEAVIPLSGGWAANDAVVPANVHFIVAENDPSFIHDRQRELQRALEGKTNAQFTEIGGTDHLTVLWADKTVAAVTGFLDPIFGVTRTGTTGVEDPRLATTVLYMLVALALMAFVGLATGRLVPPVVESSASRWGLLAVVAALIAAMPLMALGDPGILPLGAGQPIVMHLLFAGGILWALRAFADRGALTGPAGRWVGSGPWLPLRSVVWPGLAAAGALYLLVVPLGIVFHRMVPTPTRFVLWLVVALLALPFFSAFEAVVRRGSTRQAILWGALGRIVLLAALILGVALGVLPSIISLVIPLLVIQFIALELFANACYAKGRNPAVIAVVDSLFVGLFVVTLTPIG